MPLSPDALAALRQDYAQRGLRRADLRPDPLDQFAAWLEEAHGAQLLEPNAMVLSTVDLSGQPWSRTVLLKATDARGFIFYTNYEGAKAQHLAHEPRCALTLWWDALERQVNITGSVTQVPRAESAQYFQSRPRKSQLGAIASAQSVIVPDRATLEHQFAAAETRYAASEIPLPENWGGYCVTPQTIEFWQGRRSRLHDRLRYERVQDGWRIVRLSP